MGVADVDNTVLSVSTGEDLGWEGTGAELLSSWLFTETHVQPSTLLIFLVMCLARFLPGCDLHLRRTDTQLSDFGLQ